MVLGFPGRKLSGLPREAIAIFMYHRVLSVNGHNEYVQPGMLVEPEAFRNHLEFLKAQFDVIPLDALAPDSDRGLDFSGSDRPKCVLTFDDGWLDFYETAYPALVEHELPATVFLPTAFVGSNRWFWPDRVAFFLSRVHRIPTHDQTRRLPTGHPIWKVLESRKSLQAQTEEAIAVLKPLRDDEIVSILSELADEFEIDPNPEGRAVLSWEEVREMIGSGLIRFGSHTVNHRILTTLSRDEIRFELTRSKEELIQQGAVDPSFIPFSYPNGNFNVEIADLVRQAGYHLAVTTQQGWNRTDSNLFTLKRIGIHQDVSATQALFACRIADAL